MQIDRNRICRKSQWLGNVLKQTISNVCSLSKKFAIGYKKDVIPKTKLLNSEFLTHQMCLSCQLGWILMEDVKFYSVGSEIIHRISAFMVKGLRWLTSIKTNFLSWLFLLWKVGMIGNSCKKIERNLFWQKKGNKHAKCGNEWHYDVKIEIIVVF